MKIKKFILVSLLGLIGVLALIPGPTQAAEGGASVMTGKISMLYGLLACQCPDPQKTCYCIILDPEG